jgi:hypothetical protein
MTKTELQIGELRDCLDIYRQVMYQRRFIGTGKLIQGIIDFRDCRGNYGSTYYVFEKCDLANKSSYTYAICEPIFYGLDFSGSFQVLYYTDDLNSVIPPDAPVVFEFHIKN